MVNSAHAEHMPWMQRALALARRAEGMTRPNPPVGAVIVKNGHVLGEGYHRRAGGPHAEVMAVRDAGPGRAEGATIYVTLEPCSTHGRTPACTDLILREGIREVVVSVRDPNPSHAGGGLHLLKRAGVRVVEGVCPEEGTDVLAPFTSWMMRGRPFLTLKLGMTLDGRIADRRGHSQWITSPQARKEVQALRRRADAIFVGAGTVRADNPSLWPRPSKGRHPWRIVLDSAKGLPLNSKVLTDEYAKRTLIVASTALSPRRERAYTRDGAVCLRVPVTKTGLSLPALFKVLGKRELLHVLCEGGGALAGSLIRAGLVDDYRFFVAPSLLGGDACSAVQGAGWFMGKRPGLRFREVQTIGPDVLIRAVPNREE